MGIIVDDKLFQMTFISVHIMHIQYDINCIFAFQTKFIQ